MRLAPRKQTPPDAVAGPGDGREPLLGDARRRGPALPGRSAMTAPLESTAAQPDGEVPRRAIEDRLATVASLRPSAAAKARGLEQLLADAARLRAELGLGGSSTQLADERRAIEPDAGWPGARSAALVAEDADTLGLVAAFQAGQLAAFEAIRARYRERVNAQLLGILGDAHDAHDVTEDVFERVRSALPHYEARGPTSFRAWLFRIAQRRGLSELRKRVRVELVEPLELGLRRELQGEAVPAPTGPGWIDDDRLLAAFARLPLAQQQVLTLRFRFDLSVAATASALGRSVTDVTTLQSRGLRALRRVEERSGAAQSASSGDGARAQSFMSRRARLSPVVSSRRLVLGPAR